MTDANIRDRVTQEEIDKWTKKLEPIVEKIKIEDPRGEEHLVNMKAYISDSRHFSETGDLVRSFEAIVWAWSIFEICSDLGIFEVDKD